MNTQWAYNLLSSALVKSTGLRTDGRIDTRSFWINYVSSLSTPLAIPLVYPRMLAIHVLNSEVYYIEYDLCWLLFIFLLSNIIILLLQELEGSLIPPSIPLSSEHVSDSGIYLLENGNDAFIYIGNSVAPDVMQQLFGVPSVDEIPTQVLSFFFLFVTLEIEAYTIQVQRNFCF